MKKKILLIIAACAAVFVAVCVVVVQEPNDEIPVPVIAMPGNEVTTEYAFSSSFDFVDETQTKLFQIDIGGRADILHQVETTLGMNDLNDLMPVKKEGDFGEYCVLEEQNLTITIDERNGYWSVTQNDSQYDQPEDLTIPKNLPSNEEAVEIAKAYIKEHQLFDGDLGEPIVGSSYTDDDLTGDRQDLTVSVMFVPPIDGKEVYGLYRILLVIGDNGEIRDVFKQADPVEFVKSVKLKTEEQVMEEVQNHPETLSSNAVDIDKGVITDCELIYYVDGESVDGKNYAYPVYVLTGKEDNTASQKRTAGQQDECFSVIVDAIQR